MKGREVLLVAEVHLRKENIYLCTIYATMNPATMTGFVSSKYDRRYRVCYTWNTAKQLIEIQTKHTDPWENFHIAVSMKTIRDALTSKYMEYTKLATEV